MKISSRTTVGDIAGRDMYEWQSQVTEKYKDKSYGNNYDWNQFQDSLLVRGIFQNTVKYRDTKQRWQKKRENRV